MFAPSFFVEFSGGNMYDLKNKKVLVFGDSIMNGSGNFEYGVGEFLQRDYGITLYKYCVGGARVGYKEGKSWVVEQVRQAIADGVKPDLILFNGFTNDCHQANMIGACDIPLGEIKSEVTDLFDVKKENTNFSDCFQSVVKALKEHFPNSKYLFVRPHRMGKRGEKEQIIYGERAVELCKKWEIPVCDLYRDCDLDTFRPEDRDKYTFDSYNWGTGDCTHPNDRGYEEKYMPVIEEAIKNLK